MTIRIVSVLAVMIALATPFGSFISDAVKSTTQGLFDVNQNALNSTGLINIGDQSFTDGGNGNVGGGYDHNVPELHPDDGTTPQTGDVYTHGDYQYCYGYTWCCGEWSNECGCEYTCDGWGVRCINNVAQPGPILESINGEPVTSMCETFWDCTSLTTAPVIPAGVTDMSGTFEDCTNLKTYVGSTDADGDFSGYIIPNSVTSMTGTFSGCTSLTTAPVIPAGVTYMDSTFSDCASLTTAPAEIPSSVTDMFCTFYECTSLSGEISIPCTAEIYYTPSSLTVKTYHYTGCGH